MTPQDAGGVLVLNPDVEIVPVREFPPDIRMRLGGSASDFILSDRTSRLNSQRIGEEVASFLRRFREPRRIVEAVFEHSVELRREPSEVLDEIYPLIASLRMSAILLDPALDRSPLGATLEAGDSFEGYRIIERVSGLAETDVYKAEADDGSLVAIKYLRSGAGQPVRENLTREASALWHANANGSAFTPRLHRADSERDDPYLCLEWLEGKTLFDLIRPNRWSLAQRTRVVSAMVDAYDNLHRCGVLHGDVHPCNILVPDDGAVKLIDFGGACPIGGSHDFSRIGLVHYFEPEVARALLAGEEAPLPSPRGEQYCVAALAFTVLAGGSHLLLSLETETALGQIASQSPRRFEELGIAWPAVEKVLFRALNLNPADRFAGFADFRESLVDAFGAGIPPQQADDGAHGAGHGAASTIILSGGREVFDGCVRHFAERYGLASSLTRAGLPRGPKSSLYAGGAGVAWALLRIGCLRENAEALAAADVWIAHALAQQNDSMAFNDGSVGGGTETGASALFHSATGLHAVNALIRYASGDESETDQAVKSFVQLVTDALDSNAPVRLPESFPRDATNGAASLLLGAALVLPLCDRGRHDLRMQILALARDLCGIVQRQFDTRTQSDNQFLGFAHGRTGAIYSLLRWAEVSGHQLNAPVSQYLDELAGLSRRSGAGLGWPIDVAQPESPAWTGWCHGSAGHLLTWATAARILQRPDYLDLAAAAGRHIWESRGQSGPSLCCGAAGEALSLFELGRASGDRTWIDRGLTIAMQAVHTSSQTNDAQGLFRAEAGIALAAAEAMEPATSVWPICQSPL